MNQKKPITIAITGPESTGKSELTMSLAQHYRVGWVPEFAREYLLKLDRPYTYNDILFIARQQHREMEKAAMERGGKFLFFDTEMTVAMIWCRFKYGRCHSWIEEKQRNQSIDLYLLTDIDLPWQPDPLREHPEKREELFDLYRLELERRHWPFAIVSGTGPSRLENAIRIIDNTF